MTMIHSPAMQHVESLRSPEWWIRSRAATALGQSNHPHPAAVDALAQALQDDNQYVRLAATQALTKWGPSAAKATTALIKRLDEGEQNRQIEQAIVQALATIGKQAAPEILWTMAKKPNEFHNTLLDALSGMGAEVIYFLIDELEEPTSQIQRQILYALRQMKDKAIPAIPQIQQLAHQDPNPISVQAVDTLHDIGPPAIPALAQILLTGKGETQQQAARALCDLREHTHTVIPELIEALRTTSEQTLRYVVETLGKLGPKALKASDALLGFLEHDNISYHAAEALGRIGPAVLPALLERLPDAPETLLHRLLRAFEVMGSQALPAIPSVLPLLSHENEHIRQKALSFLEGSGAKSTDVVEALAMRLGQESNDTNRSIIQMLGEIGPPAAIALPAIRTVLEAEDPYSSSVCFTAFARIGEASFPILEELLDHQHSLTAIQAASTLGALGLVKEKALQLLSSFIEITEDITAQQNLGFALSALENFSPLPEKVAQQLRPLFSNPRWHYKILRVLLVCSEPYRMQLLSELFSLLGYQEKKKTQEYLESIAYVSTNAFHRDDQKPHPTLYEPAMEAIALLHQSEQWQSDEPGVEPEQFAPEEEGLHLPYNPSLLRVEYRPMTLDLLLDRMKNNELEIRPSFQRKSVWDVAQQSLLIESLLLRLPLPAFYFDASDDDQWLVIDGQQRLTAIKAFVLDKTLKLDKLEFFVQYQGMTIDELPRHEQRRIRETQLTVYTIESGTPTDLKFNIYKRINTGGLPLTDQEIRHALYQGPATKLLAELATSEEFLHATGRSVSDDRMEARELILRWAAFYLRTSRASQDVDDFPRYQDLLNQTMDRINQLSTDELFALRDTFLQSMGLAYQLFGDNAFRKPTSHPYERTPLNKSLFEAVSVALSHLREDERLQLLARQRQIQQKWQDLFHTDPFMKQSISLYPNKREHTQKRFRAVRTLFQRILQQEIAPIVRSAEDNDGDASNHA